MRVDIQNNANLSDKQIAYLQDRIHKLGEKFKDLLYIEMSVQNESRVYELVTRLGVKGNDIILKNKSEEIPVLFKEAVNDSMRYLRKYKDKHHQH